MDAIGTVTRLRRYPVKSMLGEEVERSHVTERGLLGDRAIGIVDRETGKLASGKRPKLWGGLLAFSAAFSGPVEDERVLPPVTITFPDGTARRTDDPATEEALGAALGRPIRLAASYDDMIYIEEVWLGGLKDGADPYGLVTGDEDGEQLIEVPASLAVSQGFFDAAAIHLVTTSTLRTLAEASPGSRFAPERFRPNLVLDTPDADGFVENDWPGRILEVGDVRLEVLMPVPRCVMTTLPQGDLPEDRDVLRTITRTNKIETLTKEYPCVGVYATVVRPGTLRVGDEVRPA